LYTNNNPILFSNSQGEYKSVYLTNDEVKEALIWFELLKPIFIHDTPSENEEPVSKMVHIYNSKKNIDYYNYNRLQRAVRFVGLARSESFLPAKITFYISALECLFSNSNTEVRMQVADRATRVLSDIFEERIRINKIISIAYAFRSNYIHGSVNNQKTIRKSLRPYETIEELSFELDDILREVLKRFLTDLNHVVHMDDASFNVWISELLYK
ncbi:HEPN domain-containing protein, partial [Bacillus wiedmannii]|uniref:HEPN domain-containing protein n=1 Tax=Bacillus wiedmannii TaxID=1890302 RepID=UPI0021D115D0